MTYNDFKNRVFNVKAGENIDDLIFWAFQYQFAHCQPYRDYCNHLGINDKRISDISQIPHLPVRFFKTHAVKSFDGKAEKVFTSSGTTGQTPSKHFVKDLSWYQQAYLHSFEFFFGSPKGFRFLALLPGYLEREGSSLIDMVHGLMEASGHTENGFYLNEHQKLIDTLSASPERGIKTILIGVTYGLLDLIEKQTLNLNETLVLETGGMKGKRKEMIRTAFHEVLKEGFGVQEVGSEYGMTELMSQAYSFGKGIFKFPPWVKVNFREVTDPFSTVKKGKTGGVNIIDLANIDACCFLELEDLGRFVENDGFEILGRFDTAEIRGCNLMIS